MKVLLYTTSACHLCEQALVLLHKFRAIEPDTMIEEIEICASEALMASYGIRIPVIRIDNHTAELGWPFGFEELSEFLQNE